MTDFANLADGGRRLAELLAGELEGPVRPLLLAAVPNGVPVALAVRDRLGWEVRALPVERGEGGVVVPPVFDLSGRDVLVIDDGVETGSVARAAAEALRDSGARWRVLAVPVCPRDALADLTHRFDAVVAVVQPIEQRSLAGHYADFDVIDEAQARRLLEGPPA